MSSYKDFSKLWPTIGVERMKSQSLPMTFRLTSVNFLPRNNRLMTLNRALPCSIAILMICKVIWTKRQRNLSQPNSHLRSSASNLATCSTRWAWWLEKMTIIKESSSRGSKKLRLFAKIAKTWRSKQTNRCNLPSSRLKRLLKSPRISKLSLVKIDSSTRSLERAHMPTSSCRLRMLSLLTKRDVPSRQLVL